MKKWMKAQLRVRPGRIAALTLLIALAGLVSIPLSDYLGGAGLWLPAAHAQQQVVYVPTAAAGAALLPSGTTTFTTTAIAVPISPTTASVAATTAWTALTGNHDIYGYQVMYWANTLADICWLQVYDQQPASVTVGTTRNKYAIPLLNSNSSGGVNPNIVIAPIPLFNMNSTLTVAATSTSTGNSACPGTGMFAIGHFFYK